MLANFLNKTKPINFIGLIILFFVNYFITISEPLIKNEFSLDMLLKSFILIIFFLAIYFLNNFIINKNKLTLDNSYAYFIFSLILISILPELIDYSKITLTFVYLLFLRKLYILKSSTKLLQKLFDSGFWLSILVCFDAYFLLFFILIYIGTYLHQKITIHTLFAPIIGFITPLIICFTYYFWIDKTEIFYQFFNFKTSISVHFYSITKYIYLFYFVLTTTLIAFIVRSFDAFRINDTFRRNWILLIMNFVISFCYIFLKNENDGSEIFFLILPASVIIANGIQLINKKIIKDIILYAFLFSALFFRFYL